MNVLDVIAGVALVAGAAMSALAGVAVLRFPDTMSRIHAATKPQVLGIVLLMIGLGLQLRSAAVIGLLVLIVLLQFVTAPVSAHLTVRAAYRGATGDGDATGPDDQGPGRRTGAGDDDTPEVTVPADRPPEGGADPGEGPGEGDGHPPIEPAADDSPAEIAHSIAEQAGGIPVGGDPGQRTVLRPDPHRRQGRGR
ncbi:monovalent cation/H(+) antiporter subunit G [Nakamurella leprariae]|uniref:Monovalent cation/H(+) antiporter subunit G n=1 Tax=Nakamurella leprariae TaxID=2803911 RepID=A0A938YB15_9ACTN|nr:monovalent cation/H(+) antiporter subunit G [Nakamurella leprariae]MBM9469231.1 monovalent cation/H(+) antiporter subunit G [Nakamurella leprariae]